MTPHGECVFVAIKKKIKRLANVKSNWSIQWNVQAKKQRDCLCYSNINVSAPHRSNKIQIVISFVLLVLMRSAWGGAFMSKQLLEAGSGCNRCTFLLYSLLINTQMPLQRSSQCYQEGQPGGPFPVDWIRQLGVQEQPDPPAGGGGGGSDHNSTQTLLH